MPFLEVNSTKIFYFDSYSPSVDTSKPKTTTFLIHGLGSSNSFYVPIISYLTSVGVRCVAIDTHGSGLSKLTKENQSIGSIIEDIDSVLQALEIRSEDVIMVGHSMGGIVASEFASSHPIIGVVLLGPVHPQPAAFEIFSKRTAIVRKDGMEAMANSIPSTATGTHASDLCRAFIRTLLLAQEADGYISLCNVIANAVPPEYTRITCPLLVVVGQEDKSAPLAGCQTIYNGYGTKDSEKDLKVIEGMGHWHCLEMPEKIGSVVGEFVQKWKNG